MKWFIVAQIAFILLVGSLVYVMYPRVDLSVTGNVVGIDSVNTNAIILSKNPDFSNAQYIRLDELEDSSFEIEPGVYYVKASNRLIKGFDKEILIESEVALDVDGNELINIGNVKLNVQEEEDGILVGHIVLGPEDSEEVDDNKFTGRQADEI